MARKSFRLRLGKQRLSKNDKDSAAKFTRKSREGLKKLETLLSDIVNQLADIGPDALIEGIKPTFQKALDFTPVDTGLLKASGVLDAERVGKVSKAIVSFGKGGQPPYTIFVHERTDLNHQFPTRSKFLQSAFEEDADILKKRIARAYKKRMET